MVETEEADHNFSVHEIHFRAATYQDPRLCAEAREEAFVSSVTTNWTEMLNVVH